MTTDVRISPNHRSTAEELRLLEYLGERDLSLEGLDIGPLGDCGCPDPTDPARRGATDRPAGFGWSLSAGERWLIVLAAPTIAVLVLAEITGTLVDRAGVLAAVVFLLATAIQWLVFDRSADRGVAEPAGSTGDRHAPRGSFPGSRQAA